MRERSGWDSWSPGSPSARDPGHPTGDMSQYQFAATNRHKRKTGESALAFSLLLLRWGCMRSPKLHNRRPAGQFRTEDFGQDILR